MTHSYSPSVTQLLSDSVTHPARNLTELARHNHTKLLYDEYGPTYAQAHRDIHLMQPIYDRTMHYCSLGSVLDVGCGPGDDMMYFASQGYKVTGIDNSTGFATSRAEKHLTEKIVQADMLMMETLRPVGSFDIVRAKASLVHMGKEPAVAVLKQCRDLLKPGGILFLDLKYRQDFWPEETVTEGRSIPWRDKRYIHYKDGEITSILEGIGFGVLEKVLHHFTGVVDDRIAVWAKKEV